MKKRELILSLTRKDFYVQTFKAGGPGGQNQNKRKTGVRIVHTESGATGEARDSRNQKTNRRNALARLSKSIDFRIWLTRKLYELEYGKSIEDTLDELMADKNIKVEHKNRRGNWIEVE